MLNEDTEMKHIKAINTEYKDVVYKSKSEAIFARSIDLLSERSTHVEIDFMYLNNNHVLRNGYTPDFLVTYISKCCKLLKVHIIEYKPKLPTKTYIDELWNRFNDLSCYYLQFSEMFGEKKGIDKDNVELTFFLVYGSPFNDDEVITLSFCNRCNCFHDVSKNTDYFNYSFMKSVFKDAKEYRFDLQDN